MVRCGTKMKMSRVKKNCGDPNAFNICGSMGICTHETWRLGSGPASKGEDKPRRPDVHVKQRSARDGNHKL